MYLPDADAILSPEEVGEVTQPLGENRFAPLCARGGHQGDEDRPVAGACWAPMLRALFDGQSGIGDPTLEAWRKELWFNGSRTKLTCKGTKKDALEYEARRRLELGAGAVVVQQKSARPGSKPFPR